MAAFEIQILEVFWKINMDQTAGIHIITWTANI
jgi:hypothetical protein